jgi:hypothetical protein
MKKTAKQSVVILILAALVFIPFGSSAQAQDQYETEQATGGGMMYDFLVVRPIGMAATLLGAAFFVVALPFYAVGGNTDDAGQKLVKDPFNYTFKRPLGEFYQPK